MLKQAQEFYQSLDRGQRQRVLFTLQDPERYGWNYMPGPRRGLALGELTAAQRRAAHGLLEAGLSAEGYRKATDIMALEEILGELEGRSPGDRLRDPGGYYLTLFGQLDGGGPWGWRIDGHHLSLNFTWASGLQVAVTPAFFGANPAVVPRGPRQGWQVLRDEERLARHLLGQLEPGRFEQALFSLQAPRDIVSARARQLDFSAPVGLPVGAMNEDQRELLWRLLLVYAGNLQPELAEASLDRVRKAGIERLHFAWAGGSSPGQGHYYRIQGPTLLIEYDNTQNQANHIHTVMRDFERDFGCDLLAAHYRECAHHS